MIPLVSISCCRCVLQEIFLVDGGLKELYLISTFDMPTSSQIHTLTFAHKNHQTVLPHFQN